MNQRPSEEEYASNLGEYIRLVPEGNIIDILLAQEKQIIISNKGSCHIAIKLSSYNVNYS